MALQKIQRVIKSVIDTESVKDWTLARMLVALDVSAFDGVLGDWGNPYDWNPAQIQQLREGIALRLRARKICGCGLYKSPQGKMCMKCSSYREKKYGTCEECGTSIVLDRKTRRFCGFGCTKAWIVRTQSNPNKSEMLRERNRRSCAKRRSRGWKSGVKGRWVVICERDGFVCHICREPIDRELPTNHKMAGTVDHIVALVDGGSDHDSNLLPAHRFCNSRRYHLEKGKVA
jgi:hypothetical protein